MVGGRAVGGVGFFCFRLGGGGIFVFGWGGVVFRSIMVRVAPVGLDFRGAWA